MAHQQMGDKVDIDLDSFDDDESEQFEVMEVESSEGDFTYSQSLKPGTMITDKSGGKYTSEARKRLETMEREQRREEIRTENLA